jgi:hypothetical protein
MDLNPRGARADQNKLCPLNDPKCIADHSDPAYCIQESTGDRVPEAGSALPDVEAQEVTPSTPQTPRKAVKARLETRRLPTVRGCGHKIDISKQPKHRNCQACWTAFFRNQPALAENIAKNFADQGPFPIMWTHGRKFLVRFMEYATLLAKVEALKQASYTEEQRNGALAVEPDTIGTDIPTDSGPSEACIEVG